MKLQQAHGFVWPEQALSYCKRYVQSASDLDKSIKHTRHKRVALQAGGHCGTWPKYLAARFEHVYTFEPYYENFAALVQNVPEPNVYKFQAALGDVAEPVYLVPHPGNIGGNHVSAKHKGIIVPQLAIDDMGLTECDLLVLDIEGSELMALLGARRTLRELKPVLHLELKGRIEKYDRGSTQHLKDLLGGYGYEQVDEVAHDTIFVSR